MAGHPNVSEVRKTVRATRRTVVKDLLELSLGNTVAVEDDALRGQSWLLLHQLAVLLVHLQLAECHLPEIVNHLLAGGLDTAVRDVLGGVGVHVADQGREGRTAIGARSGVDDVGAKTR